MSKRPESMVYRASWRNFILANFSVGRFSTPTPVNVSNRPPLLRVAKKSRLTIGRHSVGYDSFYSLRRKPSRSFGQKVPIRRTPAMVSYLVPTNPAQTIWRVLFHHQRAAELPC